ncbi:GFA family protein [Marinobacter confluentis]|uniref:GFA family protein n=1 Tax=Marinobacter confluentis TaxID=1697557 RepID=A0A4Z1C3G0_9GAMM|nr:GFA family protein [Marinobacter confluentis]TGN40671.1 GFA family protein [Marinobacter confluentis]
MKLAGGCHCGAVRYEVEGEPYTHALCHCSDCRHHSGAPMVGWTMYPREALTITKGQPKLYESSENGRRHFCPDCGTGLFYSNAHALPGLIDIQSGTYDTPEEIPARIQIQIAERISWMERVHELPVFDRFPPT